MDKSRFGLEHIINKKKRNQGAPRGEEQPNPEAATRGAAPPSPADEYAEQAMASLGRNVLLELKTRRDQGRPTATLFELVDALGVERDTLDLVLGRMDSLRMVEVEPDRKYGNHTISITRAGEKSLTLSTA